MFPEVYHAHHSLHQEDLPFWLSLASRAGSPILELGCGTGRVLATLASAGYRCVGVDHDLEMLQFLRNNLDPRLTNKPLLIRADISRFSVAEQFSLIILPCNTYSTLNLGERQACLLCVHRHLRTGGIFVVSNPNPELIKRLPVCSEPEFEDEFLHPRTGNPVQVSSAWQRTRSAFVVTWSYDQLLPDGRIERLTMQASHQKVSAQTYLAEIQAVGLHIQDVYGDYDYSAYTPESPSLIILATA